MVSAGVKWGQGGQGQAVQFTDNLVRHTSDEIVLCTSLSPFQLCNCMLSDTLSLFQIWRDQVADILHLKT